MCQKSTVKNMYIPTYTEYLLIYMYTQRIRIVTIRLPRAGELENVTVQPIYGLLAYLLYIIVQSTTNTLSKVLQKRYCVKKSVDKAKVLSKTQ